MIIRIGGVPHRVERVPAININGAMGQYNSRTCTISIADDLTPESGGSTLLHEVIEAINYQMDIGLKHRQIMALEHGLWQALQDHPDLFQPQVEHAHP